MTAEHTQTHLVILQGPGVPSTFRKTRAFPLAPPIIGRPAGTGKWKKDVEGVERSKVKGGRGQQWGDSSWIGPDRAGLVLAPVTA